MAEMCDCVRVKIHFAIYRVLVKSVLIEIFTFKKRGVNEFIDCCLVTKFWSHIVTLDAKPHFI